MFLIIIIVSIALCGVYNFPVFFLLIIRLVFFFFLLFPGRPARVHRRCAVCWTTAETKRLHRRAGVARKPRPSSVTHITTILWPERQPVTAVRRMDRCFNVEAPSPPPSPSKGDDRCRVRVSPQTFSQTYSVRPRVSCRLVVSVRVIGVVITETSMSTTTTTTTTRITIAFTRTKTSAEWITTSTFAMITECAP